MEGGACLLCILGGGCLLPLEGLLGLIYSLAGRVCLLTSGLDLALEPADLVLELALLPKIEEEGVTAVAGLEPKTSG